MEDRFGAVKDRNDSDMETILQTMEAIQAGVWEYYPALNKIILKGKSVWNAMLGRSVKSSLTVDEFENHIHPEDLPDVLTCNREFVAGGGKGELEVQFRLRRADGDWHWVLSKGKTVEWDEDGTPSRIMGIDINIQTLREAQDRVRQSELKFKTIFENAPYAISISRIDDMKYVEANQAFLDILGVSKEDLHLLGPSDLKALSEQEEADLIDELFEKGVAANREGTLTGKDGKPIHTRFSCVLIEAQGQKQILSIAEDITQRKMAEKALRDSEARFRKLFKMAPIPMAYISRDGDLIDLNDSLKHSMGHTREKVPTLERAWDLAMPDPELRERVTSQWKKDLENAIAYNTEMESFECPLHYIDGSVHDVIIHTKLINDSIIVSFFDITNRKKTELEREKLQTQLHQSKKLEAVGLLAGGVAHDFNNMLGSIMGYAELTLTEMSPDDPFRDNLNNILTATRRSADLTRQLLTFARKQTIAPVLLDLNESIESVLKMIRRLIGENVELSWQPATRPCTVRMDPTQLDQILINLCVNAKDAIADVGNITIETDTVSIDEDYCETHTDFKPGKYVMLTVSDNGSGMDKETMEHIFEPFYTTKGLGKGTGLGLATVYGIVKQNDGFINVHSEPGGGATFSIYVHRVDEVISAEEKGGIETIPKGNGETILIVEDDEIVLNMASIMLEKFGYRVLKAGTSEKSFFLAEENKDRIQVLITDVVMPKMNGRDLADRIKLILPDIEILFMSGYAADVISHQGVLDEGVNFIKKPFSAKDLAFAVRNVLDR